MIKPVVCFAELVQSGLWAILADQHTRQELFDVCTIKLKARSDYLA